MKKEKSFIRQCIIQNLISTVAMFIIFIIIYTLQNKELAKSFPSIYDVLEYEEKIVNDEFEKIPIWKIKGASIMVYDTNNKILFVSDKNIQNEIKISDIEYVDEKFQTGEYIDYNVIKKDLTKQYYITKVKYEENTETLMDFAILNYNLEVQSGGLFEEKKQITERQFEFMNDSYKAGNYAAEKYEYETVNGQKRTMLFLYPQFTNENYDRAVANSNKCLLLAIPLVSFVIIIDAILYKNRLKNNMGKLEVIINNYEKGKVNEKEDEKLQKEFKPTVRKFKGVFEKLEKSKYEKNKIIANISHDLKTPLTAIMGYVQAFKDGIVPEEKKVQYLDAIYNKAELTTNLVNSLVEYTKLEHPEYQLKLEEEDINEFSREYMQSKRHEIENNEFLLECIIPDKINNYLIDKELMTRLYDNLISNSLKYNDKGTKILFKIEETMEETKIIIADNGKGIAEDIKDKVFESFVTGNEARTSGEGNGLGMSIVKNIVELHQGKIILNPQPELGYVTEFDIYFRKEKIK